MGDRSVDLEQGAHFSQPPPPSVKWGCWPLPWWTWWVTCGPAPSASKTESAVRSSSRWAAFSTEAQGLMFSRYSACLSPFYRWCRKKVRPFFVAPGMWTCETQ